MRHVPHAERVGTDVLGGGISGAGRAQRYVPRATRLCAHLELWLGRKCFLETSEATRAAAVRLRFANVPQVSHQPKLILALEPPHPDRPYCFRDEICHFAHVTVVLITIDLSILNVKQAGRACARAYQAPRRGLPWHARRGGGSIWGERGDRKRRAW